jgi:hypothetical protein
MTSLKKLAIEATGTMLVRDAAGNVVEEDGKQWSITYHSPGTREYQKAFHAYQEKKSGGLSAIINGTKDKKDPAQDTNDLADFLAAVTISFNNFDYEGRVGHAAFRAAYADITIGHVAEDGNQYLGKRGNFLKPSASASADTSGISPG